MQNFVDGVLAEVAAAVREELPQLMRLLERAMAEQDRSWLAGLLRRFGRR